MNGQRARKPLMIKVGEGKETRGKDHGDPNQKQSRGPSFECVSKTALTIFKSHPIPCFLAVMFVLVIVGASSYLFMESQYKAIHAKHRESAMKTSWFKKNFNRIHKISRDIQRKIEEDHPELNGKLKEHESDVNGSSKSTLDAGQNLPTKNTDPDMNTEEFNPGRSNQDTDNNT
ncbi:hypothetical protein AAMO2058_001167800 [Amorphochlora amoebiformis]